MTKRLGDKIFQINSDYDVPAETLTAVQSRLRKWNRYGQLSDLTQLSTLREIGVENGVEPIKVANVYVVDPQIIVVDERIPELCRSKYLRPDGRLIACGGVRHKRSACPPYAPKPEKTREILSQSRAVVVIQAQSLGEYDNQKQLHRSLLAFERHLAKSGFGITGSWAAGPCRICEPENDCLGRGKCRQPKLRRFSMEGSGMAVFLICNRIATLTGNDSWKLELIKNWELPNQSPKTFKSVIAIAISQD